MLTQRIESVLQVNGITYFPEDTTTPLTQGGLDSLMLALLIIALESEFNVTIPVIPLVKEHFESVDSIEKYLIKLGAQ